MAKSRIVGLDFVKGIGIFIMILVHAVTQVIVDFDGEVFMSVKDKIPTLLLFVFVYPFILIGLWGTLFTVITTITTTISTIRILKTNEKAIGVYLFQRWVFLIILRFAEAAVGSIFSKGNDIFNNKMVVIPPISIAGAASTLDAIGWGGIIAPLLVWLIFPVIKRFNKWCIIALLSVIIAILLAASPYTEILAVNVSNYFYRHEMGLIGGFIGKIGLGRFKIAQTAAFAVMGVMYGYLIESDETIKFQLCLSGGYFITCLTIFIVWVIKDSSFIEKIVDENVPLPGQILSLGCEGLFIFIHVYFVDGNRSLRKKLASRKRVTYLFRLGMLSLTIFCIGGWVGYQTSLPWKLIFGPPCSHNPPVLHWNVFICAGYILSFVFVWIGISIVWEKVDFSYSLEHIVMLAMTKIIGKTYTPNTRQFVYGPAREIEEEINKQSSVEEVLIV